MEFYCYYQMVVFNKNIVYLLLKFGVDFTIQSVTTINIENSKYQFAQTCDRMGSKDKIVATMTQKMLMTTLKKISKYINEHKIIQYIIVSRCLLITFKV